MNRYMLIIIGSSTGIDQDLKVLADKRGINYVDGKTMFLCTFYCPLGIDELNRKLSHRSAFMLYRINEVNNYHVSLPSKYYTALFPEDQKIVDNVLTKNETPPEEVEYLTVNEILDKLTRNEYNTACLTEKEKEILNNPK